jgi:hypothetical protein
VFGKKSPSSPKLPVQHRSKIYWDSEHIHLRRRHLEIHFVFGERFAPNATGNVALPAAEKFRNGRPMQQREAGIKSQVEFDDPNIESKIQ